MVGNKEDLGNAIALNSLMFNIARLLGPSIAGILITIVGEGTCFFMNGVSFLAVLTALLAMKNLHPKRPKKQSHVLEDLREGFTYAFRTLPIRFILMLLGMISLVGMSYAILMPVFAKHILSGGPKTFGFLMAAIGVGALGGTVYLASRKSILGLIKVIVYATSIFGMGLALFSFSRILWISLLILFVTGFAMMVQMASCNTILQTIVEDDKRGRVMSLYTMSFMGMAPFGSLLAGLMATHIGAPLTVAIGGLCCLCGAFIFSKNTPVFKKHIHALGLPFVS